MYHINLHFLQMVLCSVSVGYLIKIKKNFEIEMIHYLQWVKFYRQSYSQPTKFKDRCQNDGLPMELCS